ncbi:hypothetical protein ISS37_03360 [candidate division KSB1 bacterium]|nr:hypothetical protein [candidate division KSB1 bacterium]
MTERILAFFSKRNPIYRGSLFTNQELAIAYNLQFEEVLYIQQEYVKLEGIGKYLLSNAIRFRSKTDVPDIIENEITQRGWSSTYSRHLVVSNPNNTGAWQYTDHTGTYQHYIWHLTVENLRYDVAAFDTVVRLDKITLPNGNKVVSRDRNFLKWAGKIRAYSATILPRDGGIFDLFALDQTNNSQVYLHSEEDRPPRQSIINSTGNYILHYQIFSKGFPLLEFNIELKLTGNVNTTQAILI